MTIRRFLIATICLLFLFTVNLYAKSVSNELILEKISHIMDTQKLFLEQMDKKFEQVNKGFEELREDMNKRFEQVDKRFDFFQYLLGALLAAVIGMPFLMRKLDNNNREEANELGKLLIVMKEMAVNDDNIGKYFRAGGLL